MEGDIQIGTWTWKAGLIYRDSSSASTQKFTISQEQPRRSLEHVHIHQRTSSQISHINRSTLKLRSLDTLTIKSSVIKFIMHHYQLSLAADQDLTQNLLSSRDIRSNVIRLNVNFGDLSILDNQCVALGSVGAEHGSGGEFEIEGTSEFPISVGEETDSGGAVFVEGFAPCFHADVWGGRR